MLERPYNITYELLDREPGQLDSLLRIVSASELHADTTAEETNGIDCKSNDEVVLDRDNSELELVGEDGTVIARSNRETIDDSARQTLTMQEIEELKREGSGAGKELIAKLMLSHTALDEKTSFSLAKYKLIKSKKYLRRFTIIPLDVPTLTQWIIEEKDANKILEIQEEMLGLAGCWANVHHSPSPGISPAGSNARQGGRWLVVDDTGGLVVAAMAERMGILHPHAASTTTTQAPQEAIKSSTDGPSFASSNTITLLHANQQPNLALLKYFDFTIDSPSPNHPLATHLLPISWLQLIKPHLDTAYSRPPYDLNKEKLHALKGNQRATYHRKRRRYMRARYIVDTTLNGDFTGLLIASSMDPISILRHTMPLLRGGAPVVIYSPTIEPLTTVADVYSTSRRTAFLQAPPADFLALDREEQMKWEGNDDFPLNPSLVINSSVQSSRLKEWQVLPGRTHPKMTSRGGAEGFLWTATRVIPAEGKVEARGKFRRRKEGEAKSAEQPEDGRKRSAEEEGEEAPSGEANGGDTTKKARLEGADDVSMCDV